MAELWVVLLLGAAGTGIVEAQPPVEDCLPRSRSYQAGRLGHPDRLALDGRLDGKLLYIGVRHTVNPSDSQIFMIESEFEGFRPSRVFFEGHDAATGPDRDQTVRRYGASGFLRLLAKQMGTPAASLEPRREEEVSELVDRFDPQQIQLFFLLREVVRMRDRHGMSRDEVQLELGRILTERGLPGAPNPIATLEDLDTAFWEYWSYPKTWWDASQAWFDPHFSSQHSGGVFTNEIAWESARIRDRAMIRKLVGAVREGERVLAVVGRDHLPIQEPALRCAIE